MSGGRVCLKSHIIQRYKAKEMDIYFNVCFRAADFLINRMNMWEIRKKKKKDILSRSGRKQRDAKHFLKDICNEYLEDASAVNGRAVIKTTPFGMGN